MRDLGAVLDHEEPPAPSGLDGHSAPLVRATPRVRLHQTNAPRRRADDPVALLRLILRRVRQRAFVILNPYVIPRIDPAVARLASKKMFGLGDATPVDALAEHGTPRSGLLDRHDRRHLAASQKKIRREQKPTKSRRRVEKIGDGLSSQPAFNVTACCK
jgi:hypothetical protein